MTKIDEISRRILRELRRDGRISNSDLSEKVGLSPSACLRRVRDLETSGIIKGYRAVLDAQMMGNGFLAMVAVGLNDHSTASQESFEKRMARSPEVTECMNVTGSVEYILRVECADLSAYKQFHSETLGRLPQVHSITTHVVMAAPIDTRG